MMSNRQRLVVVLLWGAILAIAWFAYAPALSGTFLLDDFPGLAGLASIDDGISALNFVFSGSAGPLGRPLALVTFLPQAAAWGSTAEPFLRVNILIHLANASILVWVLYRLSIARRGGESNALFAALAAAAVWLFMPLLASSSLLIIQRMTTLSAFFVLLGIAGYLWARQSIERRPAKALTGMSIALTVCTALAVLAKENGALLPVFVLVMEATLLRRPRNLKLSHWRTWKTVFLLLPTVVILAFLASRVPYGPETILKRDFTAWERILTESRILWEYLFNAFVPQPGKFGPFHDGYPVARTILDPVTFLAFSGWLVTLILAVLWRRRYPLFAFTVLWFLGGHLLESTVIPLELYFEHRNYLPIIGPVYVLCALVVQVSAERKRLVYASTSAYVAINALVLFSFASLWGNPPMAAHVWQEQFPESVRAAQTATGYRTAGQGPHATLQALRRLVEDHPEAGFVKIRELNLSCIIAPRQDHRGIVAELDPLLKHMDYTIAAVTMLNELLATVSHAECNGVDSESVGKLARTILSNPRYANDALYGQLYHQLMALISQYEGKFDQRIRHIEKAIEFKPSSNLNTMMVVTYVDVKGFDAARVFIEESRRNAPRHPVQRYLWLNSLAELSDFVDEHERQFASQHSLN